MMEAVLAFDIGLVTNGMSEGAVVQTNLAFLLQRLAKEIVWGVAKVNRRFPNVVS
jgi:hypothetical protein